MSFIRKLERARNAYIGQKIKGVKHYNWTYGGDAWFSEFVRARFSENDLQKISFVSVFGSPRTFWFHRQEHKIFFTGENLMRYRRYLTAPQKYADICLGFDADDGVKTIRFPLWIKALFSPTDIREDVAAKINHINNTFYPKARFASLIARHVGSFEFSQLRTDMYREVSKIAPVSCAGKLFHNDDTLWQDFKNDKITYLKQFRFSICPENSDAAGYTTEKLFEAFLARTVPIYCGSKGKPEQDLVNQSAILLWQNGGDNAQLLARVKELNESKTAYDDFIRQPVMLPTMVDYVLDRYQQLEMAIKKIIA